MFEHSIKVPRLYKFAAKVAKQVKEEGASVKDKIYQSNHCNIKALYALVSTLFQKSNTLDYIIRSTQILIKENRLDPWLARVLITELLWGKKRLPNDNKPCQTIINYSKELTDCLATFSDDAPSKETNKVKKPRYVRVNTLKLTITEAVNIFRDEGWILLRCGDNSDYGSFLATVASLSDDQFIVDMHIKDLLVFPPNTQFYKHYLYLNGDIILQDKASCLAPLILSPEPKSKVLDMCSAPGMKASQLASIIGIEGSVFAIERDQRRYQTLVKLIEGMSVTNVKCINKDVLTITEKEFPDIEYILVDPSCSGSGMSDRPDFEDSDSKCNKSRLQSLAGFQITLLRHALNNFPKAKRVVYSTCSIYSEENESVVEQVITTVKNYKLIDLKDKMKSKWFNYGSDEFGAIGQRCLYANSEQDYTNGFFVALFERLNNEEINEFFVRRVKRSSECDNETYKNSEPEDTNEEIIKKNFEECQDNENTSEDISKHSKRKKKSKNNEISKHENMLENNETPLKIEESKRKKKKSKNNKILDIDSTLTISNENVSKGVKKVKKSKNSLELPNEINTTNEEITIKSKESKEEAAYDIIVKENKKRKKKQKFSGLDEAIIELSDKEIEKKSYKKTKHNQ